MIPDMTLLLRLWSEADAPALRVAIDEDISHIRPWLSWSLEEPTTVGRTRERLRAQIDAHRSGRAFRYAVTPSDRPEVILGGANLYPGAGRSAGIGYWVRSSAARTGIASAAASALVVRAFRSPDLEQTTIQCDVGNGASAALARALGFRFVGCGEETYPDGRPRNVLNFVLTRGVYRELHESSLRKRAGRVRIAEPSGLEGLAVAPD